MSSAAHWLVGRVGGVVADLGQLNTAAGAAWIAWWCGQLGVVFWMLVGAAGLDVGVVMLFQNRPHIHWRALLCWIRGMLIVNQLVCQLFFNGQC
jgi:hypothetical protein